MNHEPSSVQVEGNIFSMVMEVAWYGLKRNKLKDGDLLSLKFGVLKKLSEAGVPRGRIQRFMEFLGFYVGFDNQEFHSIFENEVYQTKKSMGILELVKEHKLAEAEKQGVEKGVKLSALNLLENGFTAEEVARFLKMELKTVQALEAEKNAGRDEPS